VELTPFVPIASMSEGGGPSLRLGEFSAIIGKPCSGIDSLLLFTSLFTLIFILDHKNLKKGLSIYFFFVGAIGMFITNALRILVLFLVGNYISAELAIGLFHTNVGWILFIAYFGLFWWIASKFVYKNQKKNVKR
jgi:exosortase/archaeosortase family protein